MLSDSNKQALEAAGLKIKGNRNHINIIKPQGVPGNKLPLGNSMFESKYGDSITDCPRMDIFKKENVFEASHWEWTPGPGPGDFCIGFTDEDQLVAFINDYYFNPDNHYFMAISKYEIQKRDSISVNDVKAILGKFLQQLESTFSDSEIAFAERGGYNKISPDDWRITSYQEERKMTETGWGFLDFEVAKLRKKIDEGTAFNFEDINNISSLMYELSLQMRDKK
jgi:hypothetical protein